MPNNIKQHIIRFEILRDNVTDLAQKINEANGFKHTVESLHLIELWGKFKDTIQELVFKNDAIDFNKDAIDNDKSLPEQTKEILRGRIERDEAAADKLLKSALRQEQIINREYEENKGLPDRLRSEKKGGLKKEDTKTVKKKPELKAETPVRQIETSSNKIEAAKNSAVNGINKDQMGRAAYDIFLKAIENDFDFKSGKFVVEKNFVKQLNKLTVDVLDLLQKEPKFSGPVSQFVKRMPAISEAISEFQKDVNDIKVPAFETAKKIVIDEIIDKMLDNGLNTNFVQPLRDLIYRNVSGGLSLAQARADIKEYIQGGKDVSGKLGRYIDQTAQQATDSYSGTINAKLLKEFDYDGLLMTGSLIDNSSPQCKFVINELGGKITRENWPQVVAHVGKNAPLIEGTTFDNLPANRLHWGCRHSFYPIILKKTA